MSRNYKGETEETAKKSETTRCKRENKAQEKDKEISRKIKFSLLKQLKEMGANTPHFEALVDDFMFYWFEERKAQRDIAEKGTVYKSVSAMGKEYEKENPSVKTAVIYNKQKLAILDKLSMSVENCMKETEDEL